MGNILNYFVFILFRLRKKRKDHMDTTKAFKLITSSMEHKSIQKKKRSIDEVVTKKNSFHYKYN